MTSEIITPRLDLRPLELSDAPFILQLFNSPSWLEYIGDREIRTVSETEEFLESKTISFFKQYGWGSYLIIRHEDQIPIGTVGLFMREELDQPDFGFALMPAYEGRGYAFEASLGLLFEVDRKLKLPKLYAIALERNERSNKLLQKLKFMQVGPKVIGDEDLMVWERITPSPPTA